MLADPTSKIANNQALKFCSVKRGGGLDLAGSSPHKEGMNSVVPPRTAPTLLAVARRAGVSVSTASRCLSGAAKVAKSTERRILAAAKATGYHHNILVGQVMRATRLGAAQNHLGTIAFVTPVADAHEWRATPTLA